MAKALGWLTVLSLLGACGAETPTTPTTYELFIEPASQTVLYQGEQYRFRCALVKNNADTTYLDSAAWTVPNEIVESRGVVDSAVVLEALAEGKGSLVADYTDLSDSLELTVLWSVDSLAIASDPGPLLAGQSQVLRAIGWDSAGQVRALGLAQWEIYGGGVATLDGLEGDSVLLSTEAVGTATVYLTYGDATINRSIPVVTPSPFVVLADSASNPGFIGAFHGPNDDIALAFDTLVVAEGRQSFKADYQVSDHGWAGWYEEEGGPGGSEIRDLNHFLEHGHLEFSVVSEVDLRVGIRSNNIAAGDEDSKVLLSDYGVQADGTWQHARIPLLAFKGREPRLDFAKMVVFFVVAVEEEAIVGEQPQLRQGSFWIDDVKWVIN